MSYCKKYVESLEYNELDSLSVINAIKDVLSVEKFKPEQTLYCIGYILDKNKEEYIKVLKKDASKSKVEYEEAKNKIISLESKIKRLQNYSKPKTVEPPKKKKVVIVRKKNG